MLHNKLPHRGKPMHALRFFTAFIQYSGVSPATAGLLSPIPFAVYAIPMIDSVDSRGTCRELACIVCCVSEYIQSAVR